MNRTQHIAAEALALLRDCLAANVFCDAGAWREDNNDYAGLGLASVLEKRARALLGEKVEGT